MSEPLRVLLVDDEPLALASMVALVGRAPGATVAGTCADGPSAVAALRRDLVDAVFLDVQMPGLDGFGVVEAIGPAAMPPVVFVTAHDVHAVRAFEVSALDYLLKPYDDDRFFAALERVRAARDGLLGGALGDRLAALLAAVAVPLAEHAPVVVRDGRSLTVLRPDEIDWIEAAGDYVRLHAGTTSFLHREPLGHIVERLEPSGFVRVHRSCAVRLDRVRTLEAGRDGDLTALLRDGVRVPVSRRYWADLTDRLGG